MAFLPLFSHNVLSADNEEEAVALNNRLSAFNWCNPFDTILPFSDGAIGSTDKAHLLGLYSGIIILVVPGVTVPDGLDRKDGAEGMGGQPGIIGSGGRTGVMGRGGV